jgi:tetratricopeptide (TPR) repeat protein
MDALGEQKTYFLDHGDLEGYRNLLESLPDAYHMKSELLADLALLYIEQGDNTKSLELIELLDAKENNARFKMYKADLYLAAGNPDLAIQSLIDASMLDENPYHYTKIGEIFSTLGNNDAAAMYFAKAKALKAIQRTQ